MEFIVCLGNLRKNTSRLFLIKSKLIEVGEEYMPTLKWVDGCVSVTL